MIWNWNTHNTIVFSWWTTKSILGLISACIGITLISLGYEAISSLQRYLDQNVFVMEHQHAPVGAVFEGINRRPASGNMARALLYGLRSFVGIFLMLIMMTFNGYLVLAIVVGAILGHYFFGGRVACH